MNAEALSFKKIIDAQNKLYRHILEHINKKLLNYVTLFKTIKLGNT